VGGPRPARRFALQASSASKITSASGNSRYRRPRRHRRAAPAPRHDEPGPVDRRDPILARPARHHVSRKRLQPAARGPRSYLGPRIGHAPADHIHQRPAGRDTSACHQEASASHPRGPVAFHRGHPVRPLREEGTLITEPSTLDLGPEIYGRCATCGGQGQQPDTSGRRPVRPCRPRARVHQATGQAREASLVVSRISMAP